MRIKEELATLKNVDIWSLVLFALFKMRDIPEYSALSELVYVLDKDNLLKLCEYFGGTTLKIPTVHELEVVVKALVLYQHINIDGLEYKDAVKTLGENEGLREIKSAYDSICDTLDKYKFSSR